jgi:thioesterase domain-containing protein
VSGVDITVVASTELGAGLSADSTLRWGALTSGRVTVRQVPGNYFSMPRPPNVALVAEKRLAAATAL